MAHTISPIVLAEKPWHGYERPWQDANVVDVSDLIESGDLGAALAAFGDPANDLARGYEAWLDFHNQEQPDFPISWLDLGE